MTDRLRTLLHDEVESLEIPPVPATDILGTGRRLRRRRTVGHDDVHGEAG